MKTMKDSKEVENKISEEEVIREIKTKKQIAKHWDEFDGNNSKKVFIIIMF